MAYARFKTTCDTATLATFATFQGKSAQSVASVATVATSQLQKQQGIVGTVATVADGDCYDGSSRKLSPGAVGVADPMPADPYTGPFADDLAALQAANPTSDDQRWRDACFDARRFLELWGTEASELGWTAADLFSLHPIVPFSRCDVMGLVWLLRGRRVADLDRNGARLSSGNRITKPTTPRFLADGIQFHCPEVEANVEVEIETKVRSSNAIFQVTH